MSTEATQVSTVAPVVKKTAARKRTTPAASAVPETPVAATTTSACVGEPSAPRKKSKPARPAPDSATDTVATATAMAIETDATATATATAMATETQTEHEPGVAGSSRRKLTTSAEVCEVIDHAIVAIKDQIHVAKVGKNKELASALNAIAKELALVKKPIDKLARSKPTRKVSIDPARNGFLRPLQLSPELTAFMGCEPGEMRSRVAVTQKICAYIKERELQDPANRRNILVDDTLKNLLNYDPETAEEPLSYYMLQARIQRHFPKTTEVTCLS